MTGVMGALTEAWTQVRIGKLRVLLALVGVAVAVAAMTFVIALGAVAIQANQDYMEQWSGRPGTITINIYPTEDSGTDSIDSDIGFYDEFSYTDDTSGDPAAAESSRRISKAMDEFVQRYDIAYSSVVYRADLRVNLPNGPQNVDTTVVDQDYGTIHHKQLSQGRWFRTDDADDLSPALVVNQSFLNALGIENLNEPVTIEVFSPTHLTYTIVGALEPDSSQGCTYMDESGTLMPCEEPLSAYVLRESYEPWLTDDAAPADPTLEVWVGAEGVPEVSQLAETDFDAEFGMGATSLYSNVEEGMTVEDAAKGFTTVVTAGGVFIMLLGALGLINISLVTVRHRIHEIGVRRSFGASNRRIFFSIMLESVVATVLAGIVGIGIAVVAMRMVPLEQLLGIPVRNTPPFPMSAAMIGLLAATGVGTLAGLLPALVAVKIKPIDAIRY